MRSAYQSRGSAGAVRRRFVAALLLSSALVGTGYAAGSQGGAPGAASKSGLLFYLSADKDLIADSARGDAVPNFNVAAKTVPDGYKGGALSTGDDNGLTWNAPGNIYAARGTVSFFWRPRTPLGRAPFVLLRVGYADHTSWDMTFLRIDYNGHGYDAFVTDTNLARHRLSFKLDALPAADSWSHISFSWDENTGVRLYVNGKLVAEEAGKAVLDAGLDQFGMAARTVSPHQVQSRYNWMRGSDYDEFRIYDHALSDREVAALAHGDVPDVAAYPAGTLTDPATKAEWDWRYGWNRSGDGPVELTAPVTAIRKVEFADAKDIKEFMYKATDGIAETTWPGVYNRSKLPGRTDYFPLPDWNVYVDGGKTLTLTLPDEVWNHLEIQGAAYGKMTYAANDKAAPQVLASRAVGQERTWHQFADHKGGVLRFNNDVQETPIQEIAAYHIGSGAVPVGTVQQSYFVRADAAPDSPDLDKLNAFIAGRYRPDARDTVVALPDNAPARDKAAGADGTLPLVHILIPYEYGASPANQKLYRSWNYGWENMHDGLDGIAIDLPALDLAPGPDGTIALNIQVKDPVWPDRNMFDVTVSVRPHQARTLWLDLRDRILPNKSLYLTMASNAGGFHASSLDGARIRLVFKDRKAALAEHVADRTQQIRDNWGFLVEEHTASKRERLYARLVADMTDLLRVDPDNKIAREYWQDIMYGNQGHPAFVQPVAPRGIPLWAFRQLEDLKGVRKFVNWWIDNRQADYGDFGGGLSDDTDLVEQWPGLALMGVDPEKLRISQMRVADAVYKNGMFTNGLSTLMLDELHSYEDGINSNSEAMYINYGNPKVVERLLTTVAAYDRIISVNPAGHLHINTNWYSGSDSYREGPWEWSKDYSYLVLHPGMLMADYNNDALAKHFVIGLMDGLLAHGKKDSKGHWSWPDDINWRTDATRGSLPDNSPPYHLLWAAWRWTKDAKYLEPLMSAYARSGSKALSGINENVLDALGKRDSWGAAAVAKAKKGDASAMDRYLAWQTTGDNKYLEDLYADEIRRQSEIFYSRTEGHWWSDRVEVESYFLQRSRLGGVALSRNNLYPGHTVSWQFTDPDGAVKVALLVPGATRKHFSIVGFNTDKKLQTATMTVWNVAPGNWQMRCGAGDGLNVVRATAKTQTVQLEKARSVGVSFAPGKISACDFTLLQPGTPVEARPDIGIGAEDVTRDGQSLSITVHSLGAVDTPAGTVALIDAHGKTIATAATPVLAAPQDQKPHTAVVKLALPAGGSLTGARVVVRLSVPEITEMNNSVMVP